MKLENVLHVDRKLFDDEHDLAIKGNKHPFQVFVSDRAEMFACLGRENGTGA